MVIRPSAKRLPDDEVFYAGDLRVPPFRESYTPYESPDWNRIVRPSSPVDVGTWVIWGTKDGDVRHGRVWEVGASTCMIRLFEPYHIQQLGKDVRIAKDRLWVAAPFWEHYDPPKLAEAVRKHVPKSSRHYRDELRQAKAWEKVIARREDTKRRAKEMARVGDFWWWVFDQSPSGLVATVPAADPEQAVARARKLLKEEVTGRVAKGKEVEEAAKKIGCTNPLAGRMLSAGKSWKPTWVHYVGRWNGETTDPPIDGDKPPPAVQVVRSRKEREESLRLARWAIQKAKEANR